MVGVFVAFIRVVYGRMIYMSLPIGWDKFPCKTVFASLQNINGTNQRAWNEIWSRRIHKFHFPFSQRRENPIRHVSVSVEILPL